MTMQKVPGGAIARKAIATGFTTPAADAMCCSLSAKGHVFAIQCAADMLFEADAARQLGATPPVINPSAPPTLNLEMTIRFVTALFQAALRFYNTWSIEKPGYLVLSIGFIDVYGWRMQTQPTTFQHSSGQAFLDDHFTSDIRVSSQEFLTSPADASGPLFDSLRFGFDL